MIARLLTILVAWATISTVHAQVMRYDRAEVRTRLLALIADPPVSRALATGPPSDAQPTKDFLDFFLERIEPALARVEALRIRDYAYHALIAANAQDSDAELSAWRAAKAGVRRELNAHATDVEFTNDLRDWAARATNLGGDLPKRARRMWTQRELDTFPPGARELLDRIDDLYAQFTAAQRSAPAHAEVAAARAAADEVRRGFKTGEADFWSASAALSTLHGRAGPQVTGAQAVAATGGVLNELAVLRSQLARSKSYPTWAAYRLTENGQGYNERYRGPTNQKQFLNTLRRELKPRLHAFLDERIADLGLTNDDVTVASAGLLTLPAFEQLRAYFPAAELTNIWERTMVESGFRNQTLAQILIDDGRRPGKNQSAAFMVGVVDPTPPTYLINRRSLKIPPPARGTRRPGLAIVQQTLKNLGVRDLRTIAHEGGHALDMILRDQRDFTLPEAYATAEVPSMMLERFAMDPAVLHRHAVVVDGELPDLDDIRRLAINHERNSIVDQVRRVNLALYDIDLWDYNYAARGARTFLDRQAELFERYDTYEGRFANVPSTVPLDLELASYTHFISGDVRHSGYVFADLGARMASTYVSDQLERQTGRREWHLQPTYAEIFTSLVQNLWRQQFPVNLETLTGAKFSTERAIAEIGRAADPDCQSELDD